VPSGHQQALSPLFNTGLSAMFKSIVAPFGKGVLIICMLLGRLELFTVLVLVFPSFWRK
jgi:Trk-type K+ transport system membrane component